MNVEWHDVPTFGDRPDAESWVIRPSAYGIITNDHGLLAVVRAPNAVILPGGGMDPGETAKETIVRESFEECGLVVSVGEWAVRVIQFVYSVPEETHFEKRCTFVETTIDEISSAKSEDDHELIWMPPEAAVQLLTHPSQTWAVEHWMKRC